jgi:hypothetical protein
MLRRLCFLASSLALVTAAADASAQTTNGGNDGAAITPASSGEETRHTGFFLRLGAGGGGFHDSFKVPVVFTQFGGEATGATGSFEVTAGWAIKPGLIIGGGIYADQVVSPKITFEGNPVATDIHVGTLVMVGPFIDWYPKAGNFHFGGALTAARITLQDNSGNVKDQSPVGGAIVAEVGYDFPFTDDAHWALGVMARFVGGYLTDSTYNHSISSGSLLLNLTFN